MKVVLFIPTAKVEGEAPSAWLKQRLDAAITYYQNHNGDDIVFVISGRWSNVTDAFLLTEAEAAKRYVLSRIPEAKTEKEETSVETGGNFAFSKPIIDSLLPDKIVIFNSKVNSVRVQYLAQKFFAPHYPCEFVFLEDSFSENPRAKEKEPKATKMFKKLFENVPDGDALKAQEILLHKTPFYQKGIIDDKAFFDEYWEGGFDDFLEKRLSIENQ